MSHDDATRARRGQLRLRRVNAERQKPSEEPGHRDRGSSRTHGIACVRIVRPPVVRLMFKPA